MAIVVKSGFQGQMVGRLQNQPFERARLASVARYLAQIAFSLLVIAIPARFRVVIQSRPFPPVYRDYTDFLIFAGDVFLIATLVFWAISLSLERNRIKLGPRFLTFPLIGLTVMGLISVISSVDTSLSLYHSIRLILLLALYFYAINEIRGIDQIIIPVGLMVLVQAMIGIEQILRQHSIGLTFLGESELDPAWNGVSIVSAGGIRFLRAYGLTDHPNILGGCLAFALVLFAAWCVYTSRGWGILSGVLFALGCLGLFLTFSRSAWLAFGAGLTLLLAFLVRLNQPMSIRIWFSLVLGSVLLLTPFILQNAKFIRMRLNFNRSFEINPQETQSMGERELLNNAANEIFSAHALLGVGLGAYPTAMRGQYPSFPLDYQPAHMTLLEAAAEIGILGALFYGFLMVSPWLALWMNHRQLQFTPLLIGASALLLAVSVVGFFDYYTWLLEPGRYWQWLAWALWGLAYQTSRRLGQNV